MEKIIEIPEGYEARIEGNKVVLEPKESEDERIRKYLIDVVNDYCKGSEYEGCIAYLEKQKEQQELPLMDGDTDLYFDEWKQRFKGNPTKRQCFEEGIRYSERKQKEQKPAEWSADDEEMLLTTIEYIQTYPAHLQSIVRWLKSLPKRFNPQPKQEWSEEDEEMLQRIIRYTESEYQDWCNDKYGHSEIVSDGKQSCLERLDWLENRLKSLRPQPKQESGPIGIKYAGKIYKVYGTKELPGGVVGYIIEDEPGHYDCIINPDEVLGGGYGIKSNGSPCPTREANFGQPHWKPSELQMKALLSKLPVVKGGGDKVQDILESLYDDLKKLM